MTINCNTINIKKGSNGDTVKELQKYLKYYKYYDSNIDGSCGDYTVSAIKQFQKRHNLIVDGVFGKLSCQASYINGHDISASNEVIPINNWKDIQKRYTEYVKTNGKEPNIMYIDKEYPYEHITLAKYKEISGRYDKWVKEHGSDPTYMNINKTTTTNTTNTTTNSNQTTFTINYLCEKSGGNCLGQITGYHCGPHSIKQCLRKFGITGYSESTIGGYAGTTKAGTGHAGLETAIAKIARLEGITLKVEWKNFSDLGNTVAERFKKYGEIITSSNKACFWHEMYRNQYGHYSLPKTVNTKSGNLVIANSLGSKCSAPAYCGYMENRSFNTQRSYLAGISQKSICIITKV